MVIPFTALESYACTAIKSSFVLYRLGRTLPVDGQHLQLPRNRNGRWRVAYRLVACLILELAGKGDGVPRSGQCAKQIWRGRNRDILSDPELSLVDRYL